MPTDRRLSLLHRISALEGAALLGALIIFLIIIVSTLNHINDNLGTIDASVNAVDRSATSLPGLVDSITSTLDAIEKDAGPIHGQLDQINGGLATANGGLVTANSNLTSISGKLSHIESNLTAADGFAHRVDAALIADNNLLGVASGQASQAQNLVAGINADAKSIEDQAVAIEAHLASIVGKIGSLPVL